MQATLHRGRRGIRGSARHRIQGSQVYTAEPLRHRHSPLVFVRSKAQGSAKTAAMVAGQVTMDCLSLSSVMARWQARICSEVATEAAGRAAATAMEVAGGAAGSVAVAVAVEAAGTAQSVLQQIGSALAPLVARGHRRRRCWCLRAWYQHQQQAVGGTKQGFLSVAVEGCHSGCVLLSCPTLKQCVDVTQHMDLVQYNCGALRPTEASTTSENLNKRPKTQRGNCRL